ncbi:MAG: hypothetical protein K6E24_03655 [bacterium]|nr:hypothetical protein [bacterium]
MKKFVRSLFAISLFFVLSLIFNTVKADDAKYKFDKKGIVEIGCMTSSWDKALTEELNISSFEDFLNKYYRSDKEIPGFYDGDTRFSVVDIDPVYGKNAGSETLSNGDKISDVSFNYAKVCFKYEKIKWVVYYENDEYYKLISYQVLDVCPYHYENAENMDYINSALYLYTNEKVNDVFTEDELKTLTKFDNSYYIDAPEKKIIDKGEPAMDKATDYAMLRRLSFDDGPSHLPYWTKDQSIDANRKEVRWYDSKFTSCLLTDNEIGFRPVIEISKSYFLNSAKPITPDKEDTPKANSGSGGVNSALVVGVIFTTISIGAFITLFTMWHKKIKANPSYKAPKWYLAIIFGCTAISLVGILGMAFASTGGGGSGSFKTGYYIQAYSYQSSGNTVQVGKTCYLIRSDGTCSYCGSVENDLAYDFRSETSGTWSKSGSSITINLPSFGFNTTMTIKGGDKLCDPRNGQVAYKWVRGD